MSVDIEGVKSRIEKPPVLFHASRNRNVTVFEPRAERVRDKKEGARVFATPDKRLATVFLVDTDDSWANSGVSNGVPYIVISDEKRFKDADTGGAIYSLPPASFETDVTKGLRENEWTSAEAVIPIGKEEYSSAFEAMLDSGVQVYFVDATTYEAFESAEDHGISLLRSLTSENTRLNRNPASV